MWYLIIYNNYKNIIYFIDKCNKTNKVKLKITIYFIIIKLIIL